MWMRGPQLPGRAERWRQDTCVRDTPTDSRATPRSHVETHARYYWWGLWPIILRTSAHLLLKATAYSNKCNDRKKTQNTVGLVGISQWITRGPSFWREGERKRERETRRGRTERFVTAPGCPFNVTLTHRLPKPLSYLHVPSHGTMYTCMYICTCTVSKYNRHIQAISKSNSRYVTALRRCSVRNGQPCHQWELGMHGSRLLTEDFSHTRVTWEHFSYKLSLV